MTEGVEARAREVFFAPHAEVFNVVARHLAAVIHGADEFMLRIFAVKGAGLEAVFVLPELLRFQLGVEFGAKGNGPGRRCGFGGGDLRQALFVVARAGDAEGTGCHVDIVPGEGQALSQSHPRVVGQDAGHVNRTACGKLLENSLDGFGRKDVRLFRGRPGRRQFDVVHGVDEQIAAVGDGPAQGRTETAHDAFDGRFGILVVQGQNPVLEGGRG